MLERLLSVEIRCRRFRLSKTACLVTGSTQRRISSLRDRCLSGLGRVAQLVFFFFACSNSDSKATSGGHAWRLLDKPHLRPQPCIQIVLRVGDEGGACPIIAKRG